jgi:uncharacterized protein (DUF1697 family)
MPRYAAFLRGVNLGATRQASGERLRSVFEELGFDGVSTFRNSGNVVFEAGREDRAKLAARIEQGLADALGFDVEVFLRTEPELKAVAEHRPFPAAALEASKGKLQVAMLAAKPSARVRKEALALASADDRLAFEGNELYWLPKGGTRDSALDMKTIDRLLGSTTMRTKGTIEQMTAKYFAD